MINGLRTTVFSGGVLDDILTERRAREKARTGVHLSTVIDDMIETVFPRKRMPDAIVAARLAYQEVGNAFEDILAETFVDRLLHWTKPKPREHRGIIGSPDGYDPETETIDETKVCWSSTREFLDSTKFLNYCYRSLCYAHMWEARRVRIHVCHLNGDYKPPAPAFYTYVLRWEEGTTKAVFDQVRQHAEDRGWV